MNERRYNWQVHWGCNESRKSEKKNRAIM